MVGKRHCTGVILADRQLYRGPDMTPELDWMDDWKSHIDVEAYYEVIGPSWRYSVDGARSRDEHVHLGRKSKNKKVKLYGAITRGTCTLKKKIWKQKST